MNSLIFYFIYLFSLIKYITCKLINSNNSIINNKHEFEYKASKYMETYPYVHPYQMFNKIYTLLLISI